MEVNNNKETTNDNNTTSSPRRSGRERISTTIQIDGYTVKRQNNYVVTGDNYVFATTTADEEEENNHNGQRLKSPPPQKKKKQRVEHHMPRAPTTAQVLRNQHNEIVVAATHAKQKLRLQFLAKHVRLLEPFVEQNVLSMLQQVNNNNTDMKKPPPPATTTVATNVEPPKMITATLRDYQLRGLQFMIRMHQQSLAMILGDEMGLGKTLQTIAFLCHLKEQEHITGPSLVICPLSVLTSWCTEMQKWCPTLKYFRLHASDQNEQIRQKQELNENATKYDIILTTYEMAKVPTLITSLYRRIHFHYLVLDEGHKIKGHKTQIAQAVRNIHKGNTLLLTGTPLQNNLVELWSLLNFLYPEIFTTSLPFQTHFDLNENVVDKSFLAKTQKLLELFMLRRLKTEVEKLMPEKLETKVYCPLSKTQIFWYKALLMKDVGSLANMDHNNDSSNQNQNLGQTHHNVLRSLFMQLRKCCNHPYLFDGVENDPEKTTLQDLVAASGKLSVLDMLLQALFRKGNRIVLFTQFTMILNLVEDYCIERGWKYGRLDGATDRARRNYLINRFNEPNSPYFIFLMSTRSGGMGLNLQSADTCILFDSDWNPQSDIQAMGRVHRIGQTKTVHVYRLVSSGTVEERMLERAEKKLLLEMVNRESKNGSLDNSDNMAGGLSAVELLEDIKFGCEAIFGNSGMNDLPSWDDIDVITDRSRKESDSAGKLTGGTSKSAVSFDAEQIFSNTQYFGGADFRALRKDIQKKREMQTPKNLRGIAHLWQEIQSLDAKRAKKSRIVLVDGKQTGYGLASVPVLASNNYELLQGESSVFDRELASSNKKNFEVKKNKKGTAHDNQDHCQVCGEGGFIVLCTRCPCSVHLKCVGLKNNPRFLSCPHHRCSMCFKNRSSAGGLLYPCNSCSLSFCEDCLPKKGVKFLDRVERFDNLGFDSTKHAVYIHCSPICDTYAKQELGYKDPPRDRASKEPLELSYNFGASHDLDDLQAKVAEEEEKKLSQSRRTRGGKAVECKIEYVKSRRMGGPKKMDKLCQYTGAVLGQFETMAAAATSVNSYSVQMTRHMQTSPNEPFEGFLWRFSTDQSQPMLESATSQAPQMMISETSVASLPEENRKTSACIIISDDSSSSAPSELAAGRSADSPICID